MSEVLIPRSIETKSGPTKKGGTWTLYRVEFADGTKASTFDKQTADFVQSNYGKPINVEVVQTEKGKDLASAWPLDGVAPEVKQFSKVSVSRTSGDDFQRQRHPGESRVIAKQVCLKAAVAFFATGQRVSSREVLELADRFIEWVFDDPGVRHLPAAVTNAQVEAERAAIANDAPADEQTKALVVSLVVGANADAKAVLKSYGLLTVGDIERRLTKHVAELFLNAAKSDVI